MKENILSKISQLEYPTVVFLTGASILIIELTAIRILSPYFGNTIYSVTSIISTVLLALSLGYYVGGKISDKYPYERYFYSIIFIGGVLTLVSAGLIKIILPLIGMKLSVIYGPLYTSIALFLLPSTTLGMLSPYAVKLHGLKCKNLGIGSAAGEIFFWSTLGSISGSLLTGFVLIPLFGVMSIMFGVSLFLILLGSLYIFYAPNDTHTKLKIFVTVMPLLFWSISANIEIHSEAVIYEKDGLYEKIKVLETDYLNRPVRLLLQDRTYSSAIYTDSTEFVFDYSKFYNLHENWIKSPTKVIVLGGGAYSIPRYILNHNPETVVEVVEIEPELKNISQKYFDLPYSDRLINHIGDGRRYLHTSNAEYDVIVSDVYYSLYSIPSHFVTKEFFTISKSKLSENGIFIGNFIARVDNDDEGFLKIQMNTFKKVYPNSYFFATNEVNEKTAQNILFIGINKSDNYIPTELLKNLPEEAEELIYSEEEYEGVKVFTDDWAPVDYLALKVLQTTDNQEKN